MQSQGLEEHDHFRDECTTPELFESDIGSESIFSSRTCSKASIDMCELDASARRMTSYDSIDKSMLAEVGKEVLPKRRRNLRRGMTMPLVAPVLENSDDDLDVRATRMSSKTSVNLPLSKALVASMSKRRPLRGVTLPMTMRTVANTQSNEHTMPRRNSLVSAASEMTGSSPSTDEDETKPKACSKGQHARFTRKGSKNSGASSRSTRAPSPTAATTDFSFCSPASLTDALIRESSQRLSEGRRSSGGLGNSCDLAMSNDDTLEVMLREHATAKRRSDRGCSDKRPAVPISQMPRTTTPDVTKPAAKSNLVTSLFHKAVNQLFNATRRRSKDSIESIQEDETCDGIMPEADRNHGLRDPSTTHGGARGSHDGPSLPCSMCT